MKCSVVVRAGCVLLSPRFLERTGIPGAMLVKIRTPAEARGWDKSRTPTDHELPRGFPGGAFAMSALGIKERQDGRPPDLTAPRGRHEDATPPRPWSHGRAAMSHARRGRNVDLRKGGNKHRHENGGDSTGRDGVCNPHRWVGVHDFVTHRSVGGCPRLCHATSLVRSQETLVPPLVGGLVDPFWNACWRPPSLGRENGFKIYPQFSDHRCCPGGVCHDSASQGAVLCRNRV